MRTKLLNITLFLFAALAMVSPLGVFAQGQDVEVDIKKGDALDLCTFIGPICGALGLTGGQGDKDVALKFSTERITQIVSLIFIGIIIISVFIIIQAGVKYIQSQGEEGKIAESQKSIKSVFVGIAILFVGIIGLVLVLAFFGGTGLLGTDDTLDDVFTPDGGPNAPSSQNPPGGG
jgi:amino acid transporter